MIKNSIEVDVKIKRIESGKTQAQMGEKMVLLANMSIVLLKSPMGW